MAQGGHSLNLTRARLTAGSCPDIPERADVENCYTCSPIIPALYQVLQCTQENVKTLDWPSFMVKILLSTQNPLCF